MSGRGWFLERYHRMGSKLSGNETTPQAIRVNPLKTSDSDLIKTLQEQGVELEKTPYLDYGYRVNETPFSLGASIEYLLGFYFLQESASQYAVQALAPVGGDVLLDMASAPGGKTTQAAAYMENRGAIIAVDISRERLYATENNVERCGVRNTSLHYVDALDIPEKLVFTKVLLDAPCSGNYVTDNQWFTKRTHKDVMRNAELQKSLLSKAVNLLASGGELLYSTCSLEPEENELNIEWLLDNHNVELIKLDGPGEPALTFFEDVELKQEINYCRRFWPDKTGTQGFFVAKVVKI